MLRIFRFSAGCRFLHKSRPLSGSVEIPKTQRAAIFDKSGAPISIRDIPIPQIGPDDLLLKVLYSGVCHTDLHAWMGDFPLASKAPPIIGGHEGAGIVAKIGANVHNLRVGDRAGIKWVNSSCLTCEECKRGYEPNCENVELSGFTRDGTFQQFAVVRATEAAPIPKNVNLAEAAPILCAGVTVYKALKESNVKAGEIVAITGAGGGLGSLGIQYARAMGIRVMAVESSSKEEHCRRLGAEFFVDPFKSANLVEEIKQLTNGGPHGVIDLATAEKPMEQSCEYVRTRGTVVLVALPRNAHIRVDVFWTVLRTITIKGSYVGNRQDTDEALGFLARGLIKIPIQIEPLSALPNVYERMLSGEVKGRVVLDLWK